MIASAKVSDIVPRAAESEGGSRTGEEPRPNGKPAPGRHVDIGGYGEQPTGLNRRRGRSR